MNPKPKCGSRSGRNTVQFAVQLESCAGPEESEAPQASWEPCTEEARPEVSEVVNPPNSTDQPDHLHRRRRSPASFELGREHPAHCPNYLHLPSLPPWVPPPPPMPSYEPTMYQGLSDMTLEPTSVTCLDLKIPLIPVSLIMPYRYPNIEHVVNPITQNQFPLRLLLSKILEKYMYYDGPVIQSTPYCSRYNLAAYKPWVRGFRYAGHSYLHDRFDGDVPLMHYPAVYTRLNSAADQPGDHGYRYAGHNCRHYCPDGYVPLINYAPVYPRPNSAVDQPWNHGYRYAGHSYLHDRFDGGVPLMHYAPVNPRPNSAADQPGDQGYQCTEHSYPDGGVPLMQYAPASTIHNQDAYQPGDEGYRFPRRPCGGVDVPASSGPAPGNVSPQPDRNQSSAPSGPVPGNVSPQTDRNQCWWWSWSDGGVPLMQYASASTIHNQAAYQPGDQGYRCPCRRRGGDDVPASSGPAPGNVSPQPDRNQSSAPSGPVPGDVNPQTDRNQCWWWSWSDGGVPLMQYASASTIHNQAAYQPEDQGYPCPRRRRGGDDDPASSGPAPGYVSPQPDRNQSSAPSGPVPGNVNPQTDRNQCWWWSWPNGGVPLMQYASASTIHNQAAYQPEGQGYRCPRRRRGGDDVIVSLGPAPGNVSPQPDRNQSSAPSGPVPGNVNPQTDRNQCWWWSWPDGGVPLMQYASASTIHNQAAYQPGDQGYRCPRRRRGGDDVPASSGPALGNVSPQPDRNQSSAPSGPVPGDVNPQTDRNQCWWWSWSDGGVPLMQYASASTIHNQAAYQPEDQGYRCPRRRRGGDDVPVSSGPVPGNVSPQADRNQSSASSGPAPGNASPQADRNQLSASSGPVPINVSPQQDRNQSSVPPCDEN